MSSSLTVSGTESYKKGDSDSPCPSFKFSPEQRSLLVVEWGEVGWGRMELGGVRVPNTPSAASSDIGGYNGGCYSCTNEKHHSQRSEEAVMKLHMCYIT